MKDVYPDYLAALLAGDRLECRQTVRPLLDALAALGEAFPALPVWVGGQAFRWGACEQVCARPGVTILGSLAEMEARIANWEVSHA